MQLLGSAGPAHSTQVRIGDQVLELETLRERKPYIQLVHNFLSDREIEQLIRLGEDRFEGSTTLDRETGTHIKHPDRSSSTCFLDKEQHPVIAAIQDRAAALVHLPPSSCEPLQLTRYKSNQEYKPHFDYFEPGTNAFKDTDQGYLDHGGKPVPNQRVVTLFVYLTEPPQRGKTCAGGTVFPECGYEVVPTKGLAVLFHNVDEIGIEDPTALHGGVINRCDSELYTKIGLNIWFRRLPWPDHSEIEPARYLSHTPACAPCKSVHPLVRCQRR